MSNISTSSLPKKLFSLLAVFLFTICTQAVYALPSSSTQLSNDPSSGVFDFQCWFENTYVNGDTIFYPKKVKEDSSKSSSCQTWSMNLDGTNRNVILEASFARNMIPHENELYFIPTTPSLNHFSLGVRKIDLLTTKSSWVFNEGISNFQILDNHLFCVKDFSGFYIRCNCNGKNPKVVCQKSSYRYIYQHNQRTFVFENTPYEYNVSQNFRVSLWEPASKTTQLIASEGYNFLAFQDDLYYIDIKDQRIHKASLITQETSILSYIQATNMRMDENYIYFVNCEMGLLRPEYHYYRMNHNGQNMTYICSLKDTQLPLGIQEKSYQIVGQFLIEITDYGQKKVLDTIPYGGTVRLVTSDAVYYTYSLDFTLENTEMGVYPISST